MDWAWWHAVLAPALAHPRASNARGEALREVAAKSHMRPDGQWKKISLRTLHRKLDAYENRQGAISLSRRRRADAGAKRANVTVNFDKAFKGDEIASLSINTKLQGYIRGQHKNLESHSNIVFKASLKLAELARAEGQEVPAAACQVPGHKVKAEMQYRRVGVFKKDRKGHADREPGIQRTFDLYGPGGVVFGDVHHFDVIVNKVDGYQQYPKAIAWYCAATARAWIDVVLLPEGEGIRNEHVIASFIRLAMAWGMPRVLYLDNGSEYKFAEFIADAMHLSRGDGLQVIVHSNPYAARSKPIEGFHRLIERHLAKYPGYIGGDRMKSKTSNVGQAPVPFGSIELFNSVIDAELAIYHAKPQHGRTLAGRSPNQAMADAIDAGWQKTEVDPNAFAAVFSTPEPRTVRQGFIRHGAQVWRCDELIPYEGRRVTALIPKFERWPVLPVRLDNGEIVFATPDAPFAALDRAGAKESSRRRGIGVAYIRALDASAPSIDPIEETLSFARTLPAPPVQPVGSRITASDEAREIGRRVKETPKQLMSREQQERDEREREIYADIERQQRRLEIMEAKKQKTGT